MCGTGVCVGLVYVWDWCNLDHTGNRCVVTSQTAKIRINAKIAETGNSQKLKHIR